jgi:hypothetical protein
LLLVEEVPRAGSSSHLRHGSASPSPPEDPIGRSHARTGSQSSLASKFHILPPKQPRNSAGVLGALIASTGNISGAAAPAPSQLAPNIKRPGYHLSRSVPLSILCPLALASIHSFVHHVPSSLLRAFPPWYLFPGASLFSLPTLLLSICVIVTRN